jgi:hypothetical protein
MGRNQEPLPRYCGLRSARWGSVDPHVARGSRWTADGSHADARGRCDRIDCNVPSVVGVLSGSAGDRPARPVHRSGASWSVLRGSARPISLRGAEPATSGPSFTLSVERGWICAARSWGCSPSLFTAGEILVLSRAGPIVGHAVVRIPPVNLWKLETWPGDAGLSVRGGLSVVEGRFVS